MSHKLLALFVTLLSFTSCQVCMHIIGCKKMHVILRYSTRFSSQRLNCFFCCFVRRPPRSGVPWCLRGAWCVVTPDITARRHVIRATRPLLLLLLLLPLWLNDWSMWLSETTLCWPPVTEHHSENVDHSPGRQICVWHIRLVDSNTSGTLARCC